MNLTPMLDLMAPGGPGGGQLGLVEYPTKDCHGGLRVAGDKRIGSDNDSQPVVGVHEAAKVGVNRRR